MFSGRPPGSLRKYLTGESVGFGLRTGQSDGNPTTILRKPGPVRSEADLLQALRVLEPADGYGIDAATPAPYIPAVLQWRP